MTEYIARINLMDMNGASIMEVQDQYGRTVKGVFVPLEENDGITGRKGIKAIFKFKLVRVKDKSKYYTHWIFQYFSSDAWKRLSAIGIKEKIVGSMWVNPLLLGNQNVENQQQEHKSEQI